jgi:hypothetical protein
MIVIQSKKLLFVSNPKTGTTKVQKVLLEKFPESKLNKVFSDNDNSVIKLNEHDHIDALKSKLGDLWNNYKSFVFVRSPYEKAVSAYNFYLNGKPITRSDNKRQLQVYINILFTNLLPFSLWVLVKPIKTNYRYVIDNKNIVSVNHVGDYSQLLSQLEQLLNFYEINIEISDRSKLNKSTYNHSEDFFKNTITKYLFDVKYKKDLFLYKRLKNYKITENIIGKKLSEL